MMDDDPPSTPAQHGESITPEDNGQETERMSTKEVTRSRTDVILEIVAAYFKVSPNELLFKPREPSKARARQVASYLLRNHEKLSFTQIGRILNWADHSVVIRTCNIVGEELTHNGEVSTVVTELESRIDRAIGKSPKARQSDTRQPMPLGALTDPETERSGEHPSGTNAWAAFSSTGVVGNSELADIRITLSGVPGYAPAGYAAGAYDDTEIKDAIDLPLRLINLLEKNGWRTVGQLRKTHAAQLLEIPGFGVGYIQRLEPYLRDANDPPQSGANWGAQPYSQQDLRALEKVLYNSGGMLDRRKARLRYTTHGFRDVPRLMSTVRALERTTAALHGYMEIVINALWLLVDASQADTEMHEEVASMLYEQPGQYTGADIRDSINSQKLPAGLQNKLNQIRILGEVILAQVPADSRDIRYRLQSYIERLARGERFDAGRIMEVAYGGMPGAGPFYWSTSSQYPGIGDTDYLDSQDGTDSEGSVSEPESEHAGGT